MNEPSATDEGPVRLDRYLWAIRVYRTRTLAAAACRGGHVKVNSAPAKPAHAVRQGDRLRITTDEGARELEVRALLSRRASAKIASDCYLELTRQKRSDDRSPVFERAPSTGRPTKRERRQLDRLRAR